MKNTCFLFFYKYSINKKVPPKWDFKIIIDLKSTYCLITLIDFTEFPTVTFTMYVPALNCDISI